MSNNIWKFNTVMYYRT